MNISILIAVIYSLLTVNDITGTYHYCCFDCYSLTLERDSLFTLIDKSGEWHLNKISHGPYKIINDTLFIEEKSKYYESTVGIENINDPLTSYKFVILNTGQLKSESFNCNINPRQKEYAFFEKE